MYFKLVTFLLIICNAHLFSNIEEEQEPYIIFTTYSQKSLDDQTNIGLHEFAEFDKGHPKNLMTFHNFPKEKIINLFIRRAISENDLKESSNFVIDKNNRIIIDINKQIKNKTTKNFAFHYIPSRYFLPGEKIELVFQTEDEKFKYTTTYIPNPIIVKNENGDIALTAELIILKPAYYKIDLKGFLDQEKLKFESISGKERLRNSIVCSDLACIMYTPAVVRKNGGIGKVCITRQSGEKIKVSFPWGEELCKYDRGESIYQSNY